MKILGAFGLVLLLPQLAITSFYSMLKYVVQPVPGGEGEGALKLVYVIMSCAGFVLGAVLFGIVINDAIERYTKEAEHKKELERRHQEALDQHLGIPDPDKTDLSTLAWRNRT